MNDRELELTLESIGIPDNLLNARKDNIIIPERWKIAAEALIEGKSLYLYGVQGRGKSYLAAALIIEEIIKRYSQYQKDFYTFKEEVSKTINFKNANELIFDLRRSFVSPRHDVAYHETDIEIVDRFAKYPLLVLDEFGLHKPSEYVVMSYDMLIDMRYRNARTRQTIFTCNLSLADLANKYDARMASRIAGMCKVCEIIGDDLRLVA